MKSNPVQSVMLSFQLFDGVPPSLFRFFALHRAVWYRLGLHWPLIGGVVVATGIFTKSRELDRVPVRNRIKHDGITKSTDRQREIAD